MLDIEIDGKRINGEALDAQLREALGEFIYGFSTYGSDNRIILHLRDEATQAQITAAKNLVETHDPDKLSDEQSEKKEREERLEQLRETVAKSKIDPATIDTLPGPMQIIARKLLWLEDEIMEMQAMMGMGGKKAKRKGE